MPGMERFVVVVVGVADWKSSKSSSSAPSSKTFKAAFFPLEANGFGGVSGGMSSSKPSMSISGAFGLGGSAFFTGAVSIFRRALDVMAPSSYSSYSSKRSFLLLASWKPDEPDSLPP